MESLYFIYDINGVELASCCDIIECYDYSQLNYANLLLLVQPNVNDLDILKEKGLLTLKSKRFGERLDCSFLVTKVINSIGVSYLLIEGLSSPRKYTPGVFAFLKAKGNESGRLWLDMKGKRKEIYISACYLKNGEKDEIDKKQVVIEGKCIHDYYSFYCEVGYAFFGDFGYIGESFYSFDDCISNFSGIEVIWKDSELALKAIDNTMPEGFHGRSAYDFVSIIDEACKLTLV